MTTEIYIVIYLLGIYSFKFLLETFVPNRSRLEDLFARLLWPIAIIGYLFVMLVAYCIWGSVEIGTDEELED